MTPLPLDGLDRHAQSSTALGRGHVDIWSDLLLACLVIFIVLAPSFMFRAPEPGQQDRKKVR
ncbi:hypothetical protein PINS_up006781 [Pythium insidiosum]|nr:hypothetical protein PINS_up006781 [Pythium insidiosum]